MTPLVLNSKKHTPRKHKTMPSFCFYYTPPYLGQSRHIVTVGWTAWVSMRFCSCLITFCKCQLPWMEFSMWAVNRKQKISIPLLSLFSATPLPGRGLQLSPHNYTWQSSRTHSQALFSLFPSKPLKPCPSSLAPTIQFSEINCYKSVLNILYPNT